MLGVSWGTMLATKWAGEGREEGFGEDYAENWQEEDFVEES